MMINNISNNLPDNRYKWDFFYIYEALLISDFFALKIIFFLKKNFKSNEFFFAFCLLNIAKVRIHRQTYD